MKKVIIIFLVAFFVRLVFFTVFAIHAGDFNITLGSQDTGSFINDARNLYEGRGFSDRGSVPYVPDGIRVPVVPLILGLFGEQYGLYVLLQIIIASFSVVLLYWIGKRVFSERVGVWAGVLFALDPLSAFHSITILSETWFTFFLLVGVWFFIRYVGVGDKPPALGQGQALPLHRWLFISAFFLAIATLTRPVGIVLASIFLAAILFVKNFTWRQRVVSCLLFVVTFGTVLSPWLYRNYQMFGTAGLSYIPAYNWYHFNARLQYADQHGISKEEAKDLFREWEDQEVARLGMWRDNGFALQPFYLQKSLEIIRESPAQYFAQHALNTVAVFINFGEEDIVKAWTGRGENINFTSYVARGMDGILALAREHPWAFASKIILVFLYGVIVVGVIVSFIKSPLERGGPPDGGLGCVIFFAAIILALTATTGAVAEPRFRVPAEPFILLLLVYSLTYFRLTYFRLKKSKRYDSLEVV